MKQRFFFSVLAIALCSLSVAQAGDSSSAKIDELLAAHWKAKGVEPQPAATGEVFVRRIYLDVAGRIPTADEVRTFLANEKPSAAKRSALIDELLASPGYVNHFYNFWADILRVNDAQGGGQNIVPAYAGWLRATLEDNTGYDEMVRTMITAEGAPYDNGAMGYTYRDRGMPLDHMANTVRIFLGTRLECAQCHDHPFDKWTQMDFFKMAAFSYGMSANGRRGGKLRDLQNQMNRDKEISRDEKRNLQRAFQEISRPIRNYNVVKYSADKLPQLPHDYKYSDGEPKQKIEARTMFGDNPEVASPGERLQIYAKWMTSPENPRFTKVVANRLWKEAMGLGLVEPVDEFTDETEAAVPELFAYLEKQMVAKDYDMKAFLRMIYNSQAYQREATPEEIYVPKDFAFTGPVLRRMSAEQLWDSVVTLVNLTPDMGNWRGQAEREAREMTAERLTDALSAKSEQQLMNDVKRVAKFQGDLQKRLIEIQKQQAQARKNKDQDKVRELGKESNQIRTKLRNWIMDKVYQPALAKSPVQRVSLKLPEGLGEVKMNPSMVDGNGRPSGELRKQLDAKVNELIGKELDAAGIEDKRERATYLSFRRNAISNFTRAAHRRSPEQPGHFLRQFGQSDRETIENAEAAASVPQALTMINGPLFGSLANPQSVMMREVAEAETPEDKIDAIFLSLVGRPADADEKQLLTADLEKRGNELYQDVVFALMNSPEFFFVR